MNRNLASTESILNRPCREEGLAKLQVSFSSLSDFFLEYSTEDFQHEISFDLNKYIKIKCKALKLHG